jgi:hypothetical protein
MRRQVEGWRNSQLDDGAAKLVIYRAFIEGDLEGPRHLARRVHELYFEPQYPEFQRRTIWSLTNAFTSAFKDLDPIPQFKATATLGAFLGGSTRNVLGAPAEEKSRSVFCAELVFRNRFMTLIN